MNLSRHHRTPTGFSLASAGAEDRLYALVRRGILVVHENGRIVWSARRGRNGGAGSGALYWNGRRYIAHGTVVIPGHGKRHVGCSAARLAWMHFHGPIPPGRCVAVIDGDWRNLARSNLTLISRGEANRRAYRSGGRTQRGAANGNARITELVVQQIRAARDAGRPLKDIAAAFKVSTALVSKIARRERWPHLPELTAGAKESA